MSAFPGPQCESSRVCRVHLNTHLPRPTERSVKVDSDLLYTYGISQQLHFPFTPVQGKALLYAVLKKKNRSVNSYEVGEMLHEVKLQIHK